MGKSHQIFVFDLIFLTLVLKKKVCKKYLIFNHVGLLFIIPKEIKAIKLKLLSLFFDLIQFDFLF